MELKSILPLDTALKKFNNQNTETTNPKTKPMKMSLKLNLLFSRLAYKLGLARTYRIVYSAATNGFEPKEYHISRPFGKFLYKEEPAFGDPVGEGITCYVPAVDDIRRFRLDRINRFELV